MKDGAGVNAGNSEVMEERVCEGVWGCVGAGVGCRAHPREQRMLIHPSHLTRRWGTDSCKMLNFPLAPSSCLLHAFSPFYLLCLQLKWPSTEWWDEHLRALAKRPIQIMEFLKHPQSTVTSIHICIPGHLLQVSPSASRASHPAIGEWPFIYLNT